LFYDVLFAASAQTLLEIGLRPFSIVIHNTPFSGPAREIGNVSRSARSTGRSRTDESQGEAPHFCSRFLI
jgi:hypothetical protein